MGVRRNGTLPAFCGVSGNLSIVNGAHVTSGIGRSDIGQVVIAGAGSTWTCTNGAQIRNSTVTISIADEAKLIVNQPMAVELNGKLQAKGTITGNMVNISLGTVAPGTPVGTLAITGSYTQDATALLQFELGGQKPGVEFDRLLVGGNVSLAGTLKVSLIGGFSPTLGDSFDILDWGTLSGTFSTLQLPALGNNLAWNTSQLYTSGVISVTTVPEPAAAVLFAMLAPALLAVSMRRHNSQKSKRAH